MAEYIVKPDYTMLSKESHGRLYRWNFGTDTEPERIVRCRDCKHLCTGVILWCDNPRLYACLEGPEVELDGFCAWGKPMEE